MKNRTETPKKKTKKNIIQSSGIREHGPSFYYKLLIETENKYYSSPNPDQMEYLGYLYQKAIDYYTIEDSACGGIFLIKMRELIQRHRRYIQLKQCNYYHIKFSIIASLTDFKSNYDFHKKQNEITINSLIKKEKGEFNEVCYLIKSEINKQNSEFREKGTEKRISIILNKDKKPKNNSTNKNPNGRRFSYANRNVDFEIGLSIRMNNRFQSCFNKIKKKRYSLGLCPSDNGINPQFQTCQTQHFIPSQVIIDYLKKFYFCCQNVGKTKTDKVGTIYDHEYREKARKFKENTDELNDGLQMSEGTRDEQFYNHIQKGISSLKIDNDIDGVSLKKETEKAMDKAMKEERTGSAKGKIMFEPLNIEGVEKLLEWYK